jgi:hypothetical protein
MPYRTILYIYSHYHLYINCRYGLDKGSSSNFAAQFDPAGTAWRTLKDVSNTAAAIGAVSGIAVISTLLHSFLWTAVFAALSMNVKPFGNVQYAKVCTLCMTSEALPTVLLVSMRYSNCLYAAIALCNGVC